MRKFLSLLAVLLLASLAFAQTKTVAEKKLVQTLEKNKKDGITFVSEISLDGLKVASDGSVSLALFSGSNIKLVAEFDTNYIEERIAYKNQKKYKLIFATKEAGKTYAITEITGIESVAEYNARFQKDRNSNITKLSVQVVLPELENITSSEKNWLGGQIQDKLKSNLQEYLGMKTFVDSKSESALLQVQKQSENSSHDESTAIELGKITSAKFALFSKIRKTNKGYIITADFTDLTSGEQMASATSKEYSEIEYLYGSTGAVDELTLSIASKLNLAISDINKNLLANGSSGFSIDEQMALAKENEENYKKMMAQYDSQIATLNRSSDMNAIENIKKIEAEKALLAEKQKAEQKRQQELAEQKKRAAEDAKLEAERSIALKTQRDQMAKDAAAKAAEVRKLKIAKQGVLGQINIIESKKKALVDIRNSVESRSQELYAQLEKDRASEEQRIRNKSYSTVELGSDGQPTEQAKERREKQVIKSYQNLTNKFFADCDAVKASTQAQDNALLAEIRADQKSLATTRTVSSMGDELKVSFGKYEGSQNGWNAYISLYSDGVLLYTDSFIVGYEALSGKKAPDMKTELDDAVIEEYTNNVDMYNSLLTRGDPIIYFELDYTASAEADDKPSTYTFNFNKIRVINTVSGKSVQTSTIAKTQPRTMTPQQDLREITGIVANEKEEFDLLNSYIAKGIHLAEAKQNAASDIALAKIAGSSKMVAIPNTPFAILDTEVTQKMYTAIMGKNPSKFKGENNPVEMVSWYDAIYFCNKLSKKIGLTLVYAVDDYGYITENLFADGFRLPTLEEWQYAAKGGEDYKYAGSNNIDEVAWYCENSGDKTHPVAQKKPNGYGLYDMSGNVMEWVWNYNSHYRYCYGGGCWCNNDYKCGVDDYDSPSEDSRRAYIGFRIVRYPEGVIDYEKLVMNVLSSMAGGESEAHSEDALFTEVLKQYPELSDIPSGQSAVRKAISDLVQKGVIIHDEKMPNWIRLNK